MQTKFIDNSYIVINTKTLLKWIHERYKMQLRRFYI